MSTMNDVREALMQALRGLSDKEQPMDIERARAISDVAQTMINSAKVEVEYLRTVGATQGTGFISLPAPGDGGDRPAGETVEEKPGVRIVTHRLRG